ncbi:MAG: MraY family glycosyltransferase [Actinomycetota bacterium]
MQYSIKQFLLLGVVTFILVGVLTPLMRMIAIRIGAFDSPNMSRKVQKEPVPYLGGVAIAIGIVITSYVALLYTDFSEKTFGLATSVLLPAIVISTMGLIDDLRGLQPWPRLAMQTSTAAVLATILISTHTIGTALNNRLLDSLITIFWIVGVCNSINFFDNLDGGASGTVAVITLFLFFIAYDRQQILVSALAIVTAGATAGFLMWNRFPARIYMGDAGALFLGIIVSVLTIRLDPGIDSRSKSLAIPLALMAVPIMDTTVAVCSRLFRGISPFQGGRDHLSHRLMRVGFGRQGAAFLLWSLAGAYGALALAIYTWQDSWGYPLMAAGALSWIIFLALFFAIPSTDN